MSAAKMPLFEGGASDTKMPSFEGGASDTEMRSFEGGGLAATSWRLVVNRQSTYDEYSGCHDDKDDEDNDDDDGNERGQRQGRGEMEGGDKK